MIQQIDPPKCYRRRMNGINAEGSHGSNRSQRWRIQKSGIRIFLLFSPHTPTVHIMLQNYYSNCIGTSNLYLYVRMRYSYQESSKQARRKQQNASGGTRSIQNLTYDYYDFNTCKVRYPRNRTILSRKTL